MRTIPKPTPSTQHLTTPRRRLRCTRQRHPATITSEERTFHRRALDHPVCTTLDLDPETAATSPPSHPSPPNATPPDPAPTARRRRAPGLKNTMDTGFWSLVPLPVVAVIVAVIGPENIRRFIGTLCRYLTRKLISWMRCVRAVSVYIGLFVCALFTERSVFRQKTLANELDKGREIVSPLIEFLGEKCHSQAALLGVGGWVIQGGRVPESIRQAAEDMYDEYCRGIDYLRWVGKRLEDRKRFTENQNSSIVTRIVTGGARYRRLMQAQEVLQNIERYQESVRELQGDDGLPLIMHDRIKMVESVERLDEMW